MRSKKELEKIQTDLLERKKTLEQELSLLSSEPASDSQVQDSGDQAISAVYESLKYSLQDTEFGEYKMIIKALELLEKGEYGICMDCSENISEKRLHSYPNATRCLLCQEAFEEKVTLAE